MAGKLDAEFEEKEFEAQINAELRINNNFVYAPGQVFEGVIGIDVAFFYNDIKLWDFFSHGPNPIFINRRIPVGIVLDPMYWKNVANIVDRLPPCELNLFLQHKRPTYLSDARSGEWSYWKMPYYRYHLTKHQQNALEKLASLAGDEALVGYACPAFHTYTDLWKNVRLRNVVSNTNFVNAGKLSGHSAYTYVDAGIKGAACSEPIEVEGFNFFEETSRLRGILRDRSNSQIIITMGKLVEAAIVESELESRFRQMLSLIEVDAGNVGNALIKVSAYCQITNTRWLLGIKNKS